MDQTGRKDRVAMSGAQGRRQNLKGELQRRGSHPRAPAQKPRSSIVTLGGGTGRPQELKLQKTETRSNATSSGESEEGGTLFDLQGAERERASRKTWPNRGATGWKRKVQGKKG